MDGTQQWKNSRIGCFGAKDLGSAGSGKKMYFIFAKRRLNKNIKHLIPHDNQRLCIAADFIYEICRISPER